MPNNSTPLGKRLPQFSGATMVYALGGRSLFWNAATPRPIEEELRKWPIHRRELDVYYRMAERLLHVTTDWAKGYIVTRTDVKAAPCCGDFGSTRYAASS